MAINSIMDFLFGKKPLSEAAKQGPPVMDGKTVPQTQTTDYLQEQIKRSNYPEKKKETPEETGIKTLATPRPPNPKTPAKKNEIIKK